MKTTPVILFASFLANIVSCQSLAPTPASSQPTPNADSRYVRPGADTGITTESSTNEPANITVGVVDADFAQIEADSELNSWNVSSIRDVYEASYPQSDNDPHGPGVDSVSNLTSRDLLKCHHCYGYNFSEGTVDGNPVVPQIIDRESRVPFLTNAVDFAKVAHDDGAQPNKTSPSRYFKYQSGNLSLILVYVKGPRQYNWGDFSHVAETLLEKVSPGGHYADHNSSIIVNGRDDLGQSQIYAALISSFRDTVKSPDIDATQVINPDLGKRASERHERFSRIKRSTLARSMSEHKVQKRQDQHTYTLKFGPGNQFKLRLAAATTQVWYGLMSEVITAAFNQIMMDTGGNLIYSHKTEAAGIPSSFPGNILELNSQDGIHPDVYKGALGIMLKFSDKYKWTQKAGQRAAFTAEILDGAGNVLANIGLGIKAIIAKTYCVVVNPDGTQVIGCLLKDEL